MQIFVKMHTGRTIGLNVEPSDSIKNVKEKIEEKQGIPPDQQTLMLEFLGKWLKDSFIIADYWIQNGSTIRMFIKLQKPEIS